MVLSNAAVFTGAQDGTINNLYANYSWDNGMGGGSVNSATLDLRNTSNSSNFTPNPPSAAR